MRYLCHCGNIIRTSGDIPNPAEWLLIADVVLDPMQEPLNRMALYMSSAHAFICDQCGRIWVFWSGFDGDPISYRRESDS